MSVVARTQRAWRNSGWHGVLFGALAAFGVRSAGWFVRVLDPHEAPPPCPDRIEPRFLETDDWPLLQGLRDTLNRQEFQRRLAQGDWCAAVVRDGCAVAASWLTFRHSAQSHLGVELHLPPGGIYTFDAYVKPQLRGRRYHGVLGANLRTRACTHGARHAHSLVGFENRPSTRAMRRLGYRRVGWIVSIGIRDWRVRCCKGPGGWQFGRHITLHSPQG